jgi:hypothetical protein
MVFSHAVVPIAIVDSELDYYLQICCKQNTTYIDVIN